MNTKPKIQTQLVTIRMSKEDLKDLTRLAQLLGVTRSEAVRRSVLTALHWVEQKGDAL